MPGKVKGKLLAVALVSAALGVAPAALGQSSADKAAAEALFQAGRDLMTQGKFDEACTKFEGSQKLDAGLGTLLFLADCYEKAGRLASAWATFREAESIASGRGDQARAQVAKSRYGTLEPRLSKLWIKVQDGNDPATQVKRDGEAIPRESWGVALPTDPGEHTVEASAPGRKPWSTKVTVQGEGTNTPVEVPVLEAAPAEAPAPATATPAPAPTTPASPTEPGHPSQFHKVLSYVVGGVGVVGLGLGTYFTVHASSKNSDSKKFCPDQPNECTQDGVTLRNQALSSARLATVFMVGGGVLLAGGVVLFFTAPSTSEAPKTGSVSGLRLVAGATPIGGHVTLKGDF